MEIDSKEAREMSRLVRMDHTGHSTIAEWTPDDLDSASAAAAALQEQLADGWFAVVSGLLFRLKPHGKSAAKRSTALTPLPRPRNCTLTLSCSTSACLA